MMRFAMLTVVAIVLAWAAPATAEMKVELKQVHMCCDGCAQEVGSILQKVEGVNGVTCSQKTRSAQFTAADAMAAKRALDALADAGFHGVSGVKELAFKDDSGVKQGKVKSLTVTGFHNSCPGCVRAFREAIKPVAGVTGDTAKSRVNTCVVTGDFDAAALVEALNKGGFHVKVQQ